jgi:malonyl-CoA/methylmalonyl-CoA synthetase
MTKTKTYFPDDPVLVKLLEAAKQFSETKSIVHDECGFEKSYSELFGDIKETCDLVRQHVPASAVGERGLLNTEGIYIASISTSSYEFLVAFFAIRVLGGACLPLGQKPRWLTFGVTLTLCSVYHCATRSTLFP